MALTVVVKSSDVNPDVGSSRDREHNRPTDFISNDERSVFSTVFRNDGHLES